MTPITERLDLSLPALRTRYLDGSLTPRQLVQQLHAQIEAEEAAQPRHVWIHRLPLETLLAHADALADRDPASLPLYGIPFAIKDNIDLAGVPTTAACPDFAHTPARSATVVQRLIDAGAIPLGKTNLDQFATGLVGVRSPYGACRNALDPDDISGGSSSGSAVAVALGLASFSLGTDTAGSGRVPAMLNNLVGCKPSLGRIPTTGVLPACRTLDAVSIFALSAADAAAVLAVAQGPDGEDVYARPMPPHGVDFGRAASFRFGVPREEDLAFFGNEAGPRLFAQAVARLQALGGTPVTVDLRPFRAVAELLYQGPWVAERYAAIRGFIQAQPDSLHPVTRAITEPAAGLSAVAAFEALYQLQTLKAQTAPLWAGMDCLLVPTAPTTYTVAEVEADPIRLNSQLGHYTNFVNLLDLTAVAVPTGEMAPRRPFGVTLIAPMGQDLPLLSLAARLHAQPEGPATIGATPHAPHRLGVLPPENAAFPSGLVRVAVCGAHLQGLPLNTQLTSRGAVLVARTHSAPHYQLVALPGGPPMRPGMRRVAQGGGAIELEVWALPASAYGSFVAGIPAPLGIGMVELADGSWVQGFVCDGLAADAATDITAFGGWRAWLAHVASQSAAAAV